jgi:hypothetical protein
MIPIIYVTEIILLVHFPFEVQLRVLFQMQFTILMQQLNIN